MANDLVNIRFNELIAKEFSQELNAAEAKELTQLQLDFPELVAERVKLQKLWNQSFELPLEDNKDITVDAEKAWAKVQARMHQQRNLKQQSNDFKWYYAAAAAAVLLTFTITYLYLKPSENAPLSSLRHYESHKYQERFYTPDGSYVVLLPFSELEYDSLKFAADRNVKLLSGSAQFEVTKQNGKTFTVATPNALVKVLGTEFSVYSFNGVTEVNVSEGRVSLRSAAATQDSAILIKGMRARASKGKIEFIADSAKAQEIELNFENKSLYSVCKDIESAFGIKINIRDTAIGNLKVSGKFSTDSGEKILMNLEALYGFKTSKQNGIVQISK